MKIRELLNQALQTAGVVANNESATAEDLQLAYNIFGNLIDLWQAQKRITWTKTKLVLNLTAGSTLNLNLIGTYPLSIDKVTWSYTNDSNAIQYEIKPIDIQDALTASNKMTGVPRFYAWDGQNGIDIVGRGTTVYVSIIYTERFMSSAYTIETDLTGLIQAGYNTALKYNLALLLCEEFGKAPSQTLVAMATQTLEVIKPQNKRPAMSRMQSAGMFANDYIYNARDGSRYI